MMMSLLFYMGSLGKKRGVSNHDTYCVHAGSLSCFHRIALAYSVLFCYHCS